MVRDHELSCQRFYITKLQSNVMQISFFEEFPTKPNLDKIKLIRKPTKLYIAAKSLNSFEKIKKLIKSKKVKEIVYWPILEDQEGYWISPFSRRKALQRVFKELYRCSIPLMLDLELPTTKNPWLYLIQFQNFFRNKKLIKNFISNYRGQIYLAEYYPQGKWRESILKFFGLHYDHSKVKVIKMLYHSWHSLKENFPEKEYVQGIKRHGENFIAGLGTIAIGVGSNEPILSSELLQKDLELAKKHQVNECIIFRLGGLNQEYSNTIYSKKDILKNKETLVQPVKKKKLTV